MNNHQLVALASGVALALASCAGRQSADTELIAGINPEKFVTEVDGKPVALYSLRSSGGMEVAVTNYGGRIVALTVPDRKGEMRDVVLGFDSIQAYFPENNQTDFAGFLG